MKIPAKIKYLKNAIKFGNNELSEKLMLENKEQSFKLNDEVCALTVKNSYTKTGKVKYDFSIFKGRICDIEQKDTISIKTFFRETQETINVFKTHCIII